jgi:hypothetical protein
VIFGNTPFADPQTGKELFWQAVGMRAGPRRLRTIAYDQEMDGRYSYLKLDHGCEGHPLAKGQTLSLQTQDPSDLKVDKTAYQIYLPVSWSARAGEVVKQDREQEHNFYKQVSDAVPQKSKP